MDYSNLLATLDLPSLQYRLIREDMITVYKLIHNIFIDSSDYFILATTSITRGNTLKLVKPSATTQLRLDFQEQLIIGITYLIILLTTNNFKKLLNDYWANLLCNYI